MARRGFLCYNKSVWVFAGQILFIILKCSYRLFDANFRKIDFFAERKDDVMEPSQKKEDDWNPLRSAAIASGAGLTILVTIGLCVWVGLYFDEWFGTAPYGLIGFSVLGGITGIYSVIKQMLRK